MSLDKTKSRSCLFESWGRGCQHNGHLHRPVWRDAIATPQAGWLVVGQGRSYGDVCINNDGDLVCSEGLDRLSQFDHASGVICAEAGLTLDNLLRLTIPHGWFLPVTPGTKYVSLGGALANDVHGKNHHRAGTFGCHVRRFELLRSDGTRLQCSPNENKDYYSATIGGLGLTGFITWIELQLMPVSSSWLESESLRFNCLEEFLDISRQSDRDWTYTVAWVDSLARGRQLGRGVFFRANHMDDGDCRLHGRPGFLRVPFDMPGFTLNAPGMRAFSSMYFNLPRGSGLKPVHYDPFFYPLDVVANWNRLYGKRGFFQYQCVVPYESADVVIPYILEMSARQDQGSFLSVLKVFGNLPSPGLLSFPRKGVTIALDLRNLGDATLNMMQQFDEEVMAVGGAVYPAKDARMSARAFRQFFPQWQTLEVLRDPQVMSGFWKRVSCDE